jgi:hypothetical protein
VDRRDCHFRETPVRGTLVKVPVPQCVGEKLLHFWGRKQYRLCGREIF